MEKNKPSILVVTGGYFPGVDFGGIATSRFNFSEALGDEFDIAIVTRDHDYKTTKRYDNIKDGWNKYGKARVWYCSDNEFCEETFSKLIEEINPIIMYASGTITSYFYHNKEAFKAARKHNLPILLTPDGDVCRNAMRTKRLKKIVATTICRITGAFKDVYFQPTAQEEVNNLPKYLGIKKEKITLLPNLPYIFSSRENYIKECGQLKIVFSGRIHPIKNLKFVIEAVCQMKQPTILDIYGSLEDKEYWSECQEIINQAPKHITIEYKGKLLAEQAKVVAKNYDCYFLPTHSENYGYTIEEALLCGCPVIISKGTTPWDDVEKVAGRAIPLNDTKEFIDELNFISNMDNEKYQEYCSNISNYIETKLSYEKLCTQYKNLIYKVANTKK